MDDATRAVLREEARQDLAIREFWAFSRYMWDVVEPAPLVWSWYLRIIADELQAITEGRCTELVVCIPPGHGKSRLVSVLWPAWMWLHRPGQRVMGLSNDESLARRDNRYMRQIVTSPRYRRLQVRQAVNGGATLRRDGALVDADGNPAELWGLAPDQNEKVNFANTAGGERFALSMTGTVTGKRCDGQIVDDPVDAKEVVFGAADVVAGRMREVVANYDGVLSTRLNDGPPRPWRVVVMQRLHVADLAGHLLDQGVRHVILAQRYDPDDPHNHPRDPRTERGQLLCPERVDDEADRDKRRRLTERHAAAQLDQRPRIEAGGTFHREWARYYDGDPLRGRYDETALTVDCSFRARPRSQANRAPDYVVLQIWGRLRVGGAQRFRVLDQVRARMELPETVEAAIGLLTKWRHTPLRTKIVEGKANGDALVQVLRKRGITGLVTYDPKADKVARAQAAALAWEAGEVELPRDAPWTVDFLDEHLAFPQGLHDDQVDAASQLLIRWTGGDGGDSPLDRARRALGAFHGAR